MLRLNRIGFALVAAMVLATGVVFAQDAPPDPAPAVNWLMYAAVAINAVLVPLLVQVVKPLYANAPSFVKTLVPLVAGSFLTMGSAFLSNRLGAPVDLSPLAEIFAGALVGLGSTMTFKLGAASK